MPNCPDCQQFLTHTQLADGQCPNCETRLHSQSKWRDAARVGNLAEAGYLVSRLAGDDIEARLVESPSFSAASGTWANTYVLQVPAEAFAPAVEILRAEAEEANNEEPQYDSNGQPIDDEPDSLVFWRPVALMAVAGLATLWLGHRDADPRPRNAPHRGVEALGAAMDTIGEPFVVESDTGRLQHRLRYRAERRTWYLESDTTGDGRFDHLQRFVVE